MARPLGRRSFTRGLGRALAVGLAAPVLGVAGRARAAEVTAQIELSADTTRVGEAVRLTMSLESRGAPVPARLPWPDALAGNFEISNVTNAGGSSRDLFGGPAGAVYSRRVSAIITPLVEGKFEHADRGACLGRDGRQRRAALAQGVDMRARIPVRGHRHALLDNAVGPGKDGQHRRLDPGRIAVLPGGQPFGGLAKAAEIPFPPHSEQRLAHFLAGLGRRRRRIPDQRAHIGQGSQIRFGVTHGITPSSGHSRPGRLLAGDFALV